ncbi:hypothetical protein BI364_04495 [Acidihalobacter yilgarnensis]|uniref:Anaphase-promoting complex subunit 5 domain-containing protein n=1 Tax=Acidihalobacter yilgarnensis TaxID=2819280 RepID=A0A1D8ILK5_9GAMM|nr:hypothetical protein BI364_04495 [Acidihalobacter yilgarnensis]
MGALLLSLGDPEAAIAQLKQAQKLGATPLEYELPLATALIQISDYKSALAVLHPDQTSSPGQKADIYAAQGDAETGLKNTQKANELYSMALDTDPKNSRALAGQANLALQNSDTILAIKTADRAIAVDSKNAQAWLVKGYAEYDQQRIQNSAESFLKALSIGSPSISPEQIFIAHGKLAQVQIALGQRSEAMANIETMLKVAPHAGYPNYLKGLLAYEMKDYPIAAKHLQIALNSNPYNTNALTLLGASEMAQEQDILAANHLVGALAQNPGDLTARRMLASLQIKSGDNAQAIKTITEGAPPNTAASLILSLFSSPEQAIKTLSNIQASASENSDSNTIRLALAQALMLDHKQGEALSILNDIKNNEHGQLNTLSLKAAAYVREKQFAKAIAIAHDIERRHPNNPDALQLSAAIFTLSNANQQAEQTLASGLKYSPKNTAITNQLGDLKLREGKINGAEKYYKLTISNDAGNLTALMALARISANRNETNAAMKWLERAHTSNPKSIQPILAITQFQLATGHATAALDTIQKAVALAPGNPRILTLMANTQLANHQDENALNTFTTIHQAEPLNPYFSLNMASVQAKLKQWGAAEKTLKEIIKIKPDFIPGLRALALTQWHNKEIKAAFLTTETLSKLPNGKADAAALNGQLYSMSGNYSAAQQAYKEAISIRPSRDLALAAFTVNVRARTKEPEQPLLTWLKSNPADSVVRFALAGYYLTNGDDKSAEQQYQIALKSNPKNPVILNNLAWIRSKYGDQDAIRLADEAHNLDPNNPLISDTYGWILVQFKHPKSALPLLQDAAKKVPSSGTIQYHYAVALADTGNEEKASSILKSIIKNKDNFPEKMAAKSLLKKLEPS